ncbi:MAG: NUDIX domain-containing protein [Clostridia bacterium]|nr:NUDIX domain-containing protein [Clostridia bacterium]
MSEHRFDLHIHSNASDGTASPAEVVSLARERGVELMVLSDHDCTDGVAEAERAARQNGIAFLPAVEMDNRFAGQLHILGLGIDPEEPGIKRMLATCRERRNVRNEAMIEKLKTLGCDIRPYMPEGIGTVTRSHLAIALRDGGYVKDLKEAFARYIGDKGPGYVPAVRFEPEEVIAGIRGAGGVPVLAHPCLMSKADMPKLIDRLTEAGLGGIEAYYPQSSHGQTVTFRSFAEQRGLLVTCGSDYHGLNRPGVEPGCSWKPDACLQRTYEFFSDMAAKRETPLGKLTRIVGAYEPLSETEARDRKELLDRLERGEQLLTRDNEERHLTASCWIVDPARERVLLCWHNIFNSWSWTGGHADGEADLARVALKEAEEETGLKKLKLVSDKPVSIEILPVPAHIKRGKPVAAHEHINLTYVIEADPEEPLTVKPDENSALRWFPAGEVVDASSEPEMKPVYRKLTERTAKR